MFLRELMHSAFSRLVLRWQHGHEKKICGIGTVNGQKTACWGGNI